jgi:hypothetical protein
MVHGMQYELRHGSSYRRGRVMDTHGYHTCDECEGALGEIVFLFTWWEDTFFFCCNRCRTTFHMRRLGQANVEEAEARP